MTKSEEKIIIKPERIRIKSPRDTLGDEEDLIEVTMLSREKHLECRGTYLKC